MISTNSNSTTLRQLSRELYHPSLKVQRHKEEHPGPGTRHYVHHVIAPPHLKFRRTLDIFKKNKNSNSRDEDRF